MTPFGLPFSNPSAPQGVATGTVTPVYPTIPTTVTNEAILSEQEQRAFAEFLNQISADDFSMLMDPAWMTASPFAAVLGNNNSSSNSNNIGNTGNGQNMANNIDSQGRTVTGSFQQTSLGMNVPAFTQPLPYGLQTTNLGSLDTSTSVTSVANSQVPTPVNQMPVQRPNTLPMAATSAAGLVSTVGTDAMIVPVSGSVAGTSSRIEVAGTLSKSHASATKIDNNMKQNNSHHSSDHASSSSSNSDINRTGSVSSNTRPIPTKSSGSSGTNSTGGGLINGRPSLRNNGLQQHKARRSTTAGKAGDTTRTGVPGPNTANGSVTKSSTPRPPGSAVLGRPRKPPHELLTEEEKKANHIASEQKRRQNIRLGFTHLTSVVPTLSQCSRSEALILQKSVEYIRQLSQQRQALELRVNQLRQELGESIEDTEDTNGMIVPSISDDVVNRNVNNEATNQEKVQPVGSTAIM
jgi:hypothetical protein